MTYDIRLESTQEQAVAVVTETVPVAGIGRFVGEAFSLVMQALQAQHTFPVGPPFARYRMLDGSFEVSAGFPVPVPVAASGRVVAASLPGGAAATTTHVGSYDTVAQAYDAVMAWLPTQGQVVAGDPWETYLDGPEVAQPRTVVHVPCRPA